MDCQLKVGDAISVLSQLDADSIDSCVTDPPYHLVQGSRNGSSQPGDLTTPHGRSGPSKKKRGFMGKEWDGGDIAFQVELWREVLRVLKPGAHLLAFSGTRTYHRMVCAIEDAGFEIRDQIGWLYGSGFPKSLDVSKAIDKAAGALREVVGMSQHKSGIADSNAGPQSRETDFAWANGKAVAVHYPITAPASETAKQWEGWGTALKPAWEPIVVARKPLLGTCAENIQRFGTGAINIDDCRIEIDPAIDDPRLGGAGTWASDKMAKNIYDGGYKGERVGSSPKGRWPANIIHDGSDEVLAQFPHTVSGLLLTHHKMRESENTSMSGKNYARSPRQNSFGDSGSAARFFYCAKASKEDRGHGNTHPTVKPTKLMRYLVRLVTPPNGTVLDPFIGSGTTGVACKLERFHCIGIDQDKDSIAIARSRLESVPTILV